MADKTIAQKLLIKDGRTVLLVNPPRGYKDSLGPLPTGAKMLKRAAKAADVVQLFVVSRAELEMQLPRIKKAVAPGGLL